MSPQESLEYCDPEWSPVFVAIQGSEIRLSMRTDELLYWESQWYWPKYPGSLLEALRTALAIHLL